MIDSEWPVDRGPADRAAGRRPAAKGMLGARSSRRAAAPRVGRVAGGGGGGGWWVPVRAAGGGPAVRGARSESAEMRNRSSTVEAVGGPQRLRDEAAEGVAVERHERGRLRRPDRRR